MRKALTIIHSSFFSLGGGSGVPDKVSGFDLQNQVVGNGTISGVSSNI